ncbi:hypothetical protein [uncultured Clostridium sp.]|uniref:hypothetical protein n=1 Tax=uncultured Clostridium sp. TaxID=59620 RepID=UPI0028E8802C|nr:hypothetical protein [uncultured Clostridium sp.]
MTGITTALLQYELDETVIDLEQYTTVESVIQSYKLGIKAFNEIEEFIKQYDNKCNYKKRNTLFYTVKSSDIAQVKEEYEIRKENGFNLEKLFYVML